jgi:hypothetical protein
MTDPDRPPKGPVSDSADAIDADAVEPGTTFSSETRMFFVIGLLTLVMAIIYTVTADEAAEKVLLALVAVFSLVMAGFLAVRDRRGGSSLFEDSEPRGDEPPRTWFPTSSMWPFTVAAGTALLVAGLALGLWVLFPGLFLLAQGLWSFTMESRRRGA